MTKINKIMYSKTDKIVFLLNVITALSAVIIIEYYVNYVSKGREPLVEFISYCFLLLVALAFFLFNLKLSRTIAYLLTAISTLFVASILFTIIRSYF
jgi:hypothetical protein